MSSVSISSVTVTTTSVTTITDPASIQSFNRGPLTTTFTPPTSCLSTLTAVTSPGATTIDLGEGHWITGDPACYPDGTIGADALQYTASWETYFYSPGLQCPTGWHTVALLRSNFKGMSLGSGTSGAICCPTNMVLSTGGYDCFTPIPPNFGLTVSSSGTVGPTFFPTATRAFADSIPLLWQLSDLPIPGGLTSSSTASLTTITSPPPSTITTSIITSNSTQVSSSSITSTSSTSTSTSSSSNSSSSSGLSTGAKVGIAIAVAAVISLFAAGAVLLWRRRRQQKEPVRPKITVVREDDFSDKYHSYIPIELDFDTRPAPVPGQQSGHQPGVQ